MATKTTVKKPTKLSFTKKAYEEDAYAATKTAMTQVYDTLNDGFGKVNDDITTLTAQVSTIANAVNPPKKVAAGAKKTQEKMAAVNNGSLGYSLGCTAANVRAVQHPVAGAHLAGRGIAGFFQAFRDGWRDQQMRYDSMVEELEQRRAVREQEQSAQASVA